MTDLFDHARGVADQDAQPPTAASRRASERRRRTKRRAQRRRNIISFVVMLIALALLIGGGWVLVGPLLKPDDGPETITDYPGPGSGSVEVVIPDGASGGDMATILVDADVVATRGAFIAAYSANPDAAGIQPGTYSLLRQMRADYAVAMMLDPASLADNLITIPEGWRASQIYERIANQLEVDVADVETAAEDVAQNYLPDEANGEIEGWLLAARYNISPDDTPKSILKQMVDRTVSALDDLEVPRDQREDMLTIASIVEAEVVLPDDRGKVARVVDNRLAGCSGDGAIGMDSTLAYGLDTPAAEITGAQWNDASLPYNTREVPGLPPTPINSPGQPSIEAALDPPAGNWCYFVTVNLDNGETLFTDDYAEHKQNQAQYREWVAENR